MFLLEQIVQPDLVVPSLDYRVFIQDNRKILLPTGVLAPVVINVDGFIQSTVADANLRPEMSLLEMLSRTRRASRGSTFARISENARDLHNARIPTSYSAEGINSMLDIFDNLTTTELIKALIAEYPVALWGVAASLPPEAITAITIENLSWTLKAMTENYKHMKRVSRYALKLITYICRSYDYDKDSREVLEEIFSENYWDFYSESRASILPLMILGMGYAGEVHDAGKGRILQIIYQPKFLSPEERAIVDSHILLSIDIAETFKNCFDYALTLFAPQNLQIWDKIHSYAMRVIAEHHPERSGRHTTSGDILSAADVFDVITQPRIYKLDYKRPAEALFEMKTIPHLNPRVVRLLARAFDTNMPERIRF